MGGLLFDDVLESFVDGIFAEHVGFDLLYLFEDGFFVLIVVFVEFITVGFDSVSD